MATILLLLLDSTDNNLENKLNNYLIELLKSFKMIMHNNINNKKNKRYQSLNQK
jgi:hypothetical protein